VLVPFHASIRNVLFHVVHVNAALFLVLDNHWFNAYCMPIY
jgi:hypothetical protein